MRHLGQQPIIDRLQGRPGIEEDSIREQNNGSSEQKIYEQTICVLIDRHHTCRMALSCFKSHPAPSLRSCALGAEEMELVLHPDHKAERGDDAEIVSAVVDTADVGFVGVR